MATVIQHRQLTELMQISASRKTRLAIWQATIDSNSSHSSNTLQIFHKFYAASQGTKVDSRSNITAAYVGRTSEVESLVLSQRILAKKVNKNSQLNWSVQLISIFICLDWQLPTEQQRCASRRAITDTPQQLRLQCFAAVATRQGGRLKCFVATNFLSCDQTIHPQH